MADNDALDIEQEGHTKWYVIRVISGKERKLKELIEYEIERTGWTDAVPSGFDTY